MQKSFLTFLFLTGLLSFPSTVFAGLASEDSVIRDWRAELSKNYQLAPSGRETATALHGKTWSCLVRRSQAGNFSVDGFPGYTVIQGNLFYDYDMSPATYRSPLWLSMGLAKGLYGYFAHYSGRYYNHAILIPAPDFSSYILEYSTDAPAPVAEPSIVFPGKVTYEYQRCLLVH